MARWLVGFTLSPSEPRESCVRTGHDSLGADGDTVNPTNQRAIQHTHLREGFFRRLTTRFSGR